MSITQISVFVESKPGHMGRVLGAFADNAINVHGFSASDTGEYGIVRFVVDDTQRAEEVLKGMGAAVRKAKVLCVKLDDSVGQLQKAMEALAGAQLNISYCYSLASTYIAISVKDIPAAEEALRAAGMAVVDDDDLAEFMVGETM